MGRYVVDYNDMTQTSVRTEAVRRVRRFAIKRGSLSSLFNRFETVHTVVSFSNFCTHGRIPRSSDRLASKRDKTRKLVFVSFA